MRTLARLTCSILTATALASPATATTLEGPIAQLEPLLGSWEVEAQWIGGPRLWARTTYSPGIGGRSVEARVLVKDGDGAPYPRYFTVLAHDAERDVLVAHNFQHDGSVSKLDFTFEDGTVVMEWTEGEARIRDRTRLLGDGKLRWQVEMAQGEGGAYRQLMDATWVRQAENGRPSPIDPNLFVPGETESFTVEAITRAPVGAVYAAWSDGEAFAAAYGPDREELRADVDLMIGGRFEWLWDGKIGSNGCQVLSYVPDRMISFSWNAPPQQVDSRPQRTWVVVELEPTSSGGTRTRLTHLGFGDTEAWRQTRDYFQRAWPHVLETLGRNLEARLGDAESSS